MRDNLLTYHVNGMIWVTNCGTGEKLVCGPRIRLKLSSPDKAANEYMEVCRGRYGPCRKEVITIYRGL